jgi:hypothetical protein
MKGPVRSVVITVTNGQVEVNPEDVIVSKKYQEGVDWYCPQGEASITFKDTPFDSDHFISPRGGGVYSGNVRGHKGSYKYTVVVRIPGDRRDYVKDPQVIVED